MIVAAAAAAATADAGVNGIASGARGANGFYFDVIGACRDGAFDAEISSVATIVVAFQRGAGVVFERPFGIEASGGVHSQGAGLADLHLEVIDIAAGFDCSGQRTARSQPGCQRPRVGVVIRTTVAAFIVAIVVGPIAARHANRARSDAPVLDTTSPRGNTGISSSIL